MNNIAAFKQFSILCFFPFLLQFQSSLSLAINSTNPKSLGTDSSASMTPKQLECVKKPLSASLWDEYQMNDYLRTYPGGFNISTLDYADVIGVTNFNCGIGDRCNPSQSCLSLTPQDWMALVSAHRFNNILNQIYQATAYALGVVSDVSSTMVDDLIPNAANFWTYAAVYVGVLAASITGTPAMIFGTTGKIIWMMLMTSMFIGSATTWFFANLGVPDPKKFTRWSEVLYSLQDFENHMQSALSQFSSSWIRAPISSSQGLFGIAQNGTLFQDLYRGANEKGEFLTDDRTQIEIQSDIELTLKLRSLAHILKIQNAFIVRGDEQCNGDGPAGARGGSDNISYCDENGIMMNLVLVGTESQPEKKLHNAALIEKKYGMSAEVLTKAAWSCQARFGVSSVSILSATPQLVFNSSISSFERVSNCAFDLPVCDMTDSRLRSKRKEMGLLEACRKVGKLPI